MRRGSLAMSVALLLGSVTAYAQEESEDGDVVELGGVAVRGGGDSFVLPTEPLDGAFGLSKSILETPRSVSAVSTEMLEQYAIDNIEGLAAIVPNSYTTSAFGIAGSLDLRGTSTENYFRGMKRIENGGVYPTPIGATDRVEIVRGPPSPVYGPGKIGGYLNFVPKAARASTGRFLTEPTSRSRLTYGSYDRRMVTVEQGGPLNLTDRDIGYYVYVMLENSGSWYRNAGQEQLLVQSSFDAVLNDRWRLEFGQQHHQWESIELSGINRLTQEFIDSRGANYLSGRPLLNLDTDGDGFISPAEFAAFGPTQITIPYGTAPEDIVLPPLFALDPDTVQYVNLPDNAILSDASDFANATSSIFYFDIINDSNPDLVFENKSILDTIKRTKDTTQGFATQADGYLFENKTVLRQQMEPADWLQMTNIAAASVRYFNGTNRSFSGATQPFNRRDLSAGPTGFDRVLNPLHDPQQAPWIANRDSRHTTWGLGGLTDMQVGENLTVMLGGRVDYISIKASADPNSVADGPPTGPAKTTGVSNSETAWSYTGSVSYALTPTIIPYVTHSKQQSMQIGNIGDIIPGNVASPLTDSTLYEAGIKLSLLDGMLYSGLSVYRQTREQIDSETFEAFSTKAEGYELELRYMPTSRLAITGAANWQKTVYLTPPSAFSVTPEFFGLSGADAYGGLLRVSGLPADAGYNKRGGLPHRVFSLFGTYTFAGGFGASLGAVYTDSMASGSARTLILPSVTRFDGSLFYSSRTWDLRLGIHNITSERYFQAINPDNIGNTVALPKPPRTFEASVGYRF